MFERFNFSPRQIDKYYQSAKRDFKIAFSSDIPEVAFRFCYDTLLKLAITVCAGKGLRIKSRRGHHIELIKKLSYYLNDSEIEVIADDMRSKRNWDLYGGGVLISTKEARDYVNWTKSVFLKAEKYIGSKYPRLNL